MIVNDEEYLDTESTIALLAVSRESFYHRSRPLLRVYHFSGRRKPWYKKSDVLALKEGKSTQRTIITLSGILKDWTAYVQSLGIGADTTNAEIMVTTLPAATATLFNIDPTRQFVKRQRVTLAQLVYLCVWDTYYPLELVEADLHEIKHNFDFHVVEAIKARHGLTIGYSKERYSARPASFREQEQMQLITDEPILNLQRISFTRDRKTLILLSDMALRGNWFAVEREEHVKIWDE